MNDFRTEWKGWSELPLHKEGHTGKYPRYQSFLFELVQSVNPDNIFEIGFNAGHSACCFLNAAPQAKMVTFDICRHGTEQPALKVLQKYFDITLIPGDSVKTVPVWLENNPTQFDLMFIDGYHLNDHPYLDIVNSYKRCKVGGVVLVDDLHIPDVKTSFNKVDWTGFEEISVPSIEKIIKVYRRVE